MSAPLIQTVIPFDATQDYVLSFSYLGFQVRKNKVIIRDNTTNLIVYEQKIISTLLKHTVPAKRLTNGMTYNIQVQVYDIDDKGSPLSNMIVFSCAATPLFVFNNLSSDDVIKESYINLQIKYNQLNGELLNTYVVQLYNFSKQLIYTSDTKNSNELSTMISGLEHNSQYYMRAIGETVNHILLDTGYIPFLCNYLKPATFSYLELSNKNREASVAITSNIISIEGYSNSEPIYIDGKMLDLSADGKNVIFDEAFNIRDNFTRHIQGRNFNNGKVFYTAKDKFSSDEIRLSWWTYLDYKTKTPKESTVRLEVDGKLGVYTLYSDRITPPIKTDMIHIWLRHINGSYELKIKNKGGI